MGFLISIDGKWIKIIYDENCDIVSKIVNIEELFSVEITKANDPKSTHIITINRKDGSKIHSHGNIKEEAWRQYDLISSILTKWEPEPVVVEDLSKTGKMTAMECNNLFKEAPAE